MLILTTLMAALLVVMVGYRDLPISRMLHHWLVEKPAARLSRLDRRHAILLLLLAVILIAGGEMLAAAGPLDMSMILLWDISVYLDAAVTTVAIASAARSMAVGRYIKTLAVRRLARRGHARSRRIARVSRTGRPAANDKDRPALAQAA